MHSFLYIENSVFFAEEAVQQQQLFTLLFLCCQMTIGCDMVKIFKYFLFGELVINLYIESHIFVIIIIQ